MKSQSILIKDELKDYIISKEGKIVVLECKLSNLITNRNIPYSVQWYKNSNIIVPSDKIKSYDDRRWQKLELKCVTKEDEGIYSLVINTAVVNDYSKCVLYIKSDAYDNVTYSVPNTVGEQFDINAKLRSGNYQEGEKIILQAVFSTNITNCMWYKGNKRIHLKQPHVLLDSEDATTSTLCLNTPKKSDSGIYCALGFTSDQGYLCNYANVLVASRAMTSLFSNTLPHVWSLPKFTKVFDKDDIRLIFKISHETNTVIEWTKDGKEIKLNERIKCQTYGNRHFSLTVHDARCSDTGTYYLMLKQTVPIGVESYAKVIVREYTLPRPPPCAVTKALKSSVVCIGNGVTFSCSFQIPNIKYTFVVWIVGENTIARSNQRFKVISGENEYLLHIPVVVPTMSGEIICQLRQHVVRKKSILLTKSRGYLTVLPYSVHASEQNFPYKESNIYKEEGMAMISRPNNSLRSTNYSNIILYFKFSVISDIGLFFTVGDDTAESNVTGVAECKKLPRDTRLPFPTMGSWRIDWVGPVEKVWYVIDLCQSNGCYVKIGNSKSPRIDIKEPPEDTLYKFRVRTMRPRKKSKIPSVFCFLPPETALRKSKAKRKTLTHPQFKKLYVNHMKLHRGSFGVLNLVRNRINGEIFATKTSRFANQIKRNRAKMEFDITKQLVHPQTVAFIDGFTTRNGNGQIIMMEYLWGSELTKGNVVGKKFEEADVIVYLRYVLLAVQYLHSKKIAHLNIQPENVLFINRNSRVVKLVDYSKARVVEPPVVLPVYRGSHVAPEIIHKKPVGTYSDMWSVGALTFYLLTGKMPFESMISWIRVARNISRVRYQYKERHMRTISDRAKAFVSRLLRRNPNDRITAIMALNDIWITQGPGEGRPEKAQLQCHDGLYLVEPAYAAQLRWKRAILGIYAVVVFLSLRRSDEPMDEGSSNSSL